jgi:hypothetical protein
MRNSLLSVFILMMLAALARADGLIYQLPPDGTSARYDTESTATVDGQERTSKGSLTISSVGKAQVDGEDCRWIEIKSITRVNDTDRISITKCLIPEKFLAKGQSPGEKIVRGWSKFGDNDVQELRDTAGPRGRLLPFYLAGPAAVTTDLDPIEVESKLGKLPCKGVSGEQEFQRDNGSVGIKFENRLHEKAPFGLVSARWQIERRVNGQSMGQRTIKLVLADVNTTALSELPDRN